MLEAVFDIKIKWYNLGLQLGISASRLDEIKQQFSQLDDALREMLRVWLKQQESCTWITLARTLRKKSVDGEELAREIESNYCAIPHEGVEGTKLTKTLIIG